MAVSAKVVTVNLYAVSYTHLSINLNEYNLKAWVYGHWHINYMKKQGDVYSVCTSSLDKGDDSEIITLIYGQDVTTEEIEVVEEYVENTFEAELECVEGKQPVYSFIVGVE